MLLEGKLLPAHIVIIEADSQFDRRSRRYRQCRRNVPNEPASQGST